MTERQIGRETDTQQKRKGEERELRAQRVTVRKRASDRERERKGSLLEKDRKSEEETNMERISRCIDPCEEIRSL